MDLYKIVEEYAALGDHRTGTAVDRATIEWFCDQLRGIGAGVETVEFSIDLYRAHWRVSLDNEEVLSLPLYYEATGRIRTTSVCHDVLRVENYAAAFRDLPGILSAAKRSGSKALVVATECPNNSLYAINRKPISAGGIPTLLVAGNLAAWLDTASIEVELDAKIEPGVSTNVVGRMGDGEDLPIVITTPLSGWFQCAGERGTGIAIALSLACALAQTSKVVLVATSAHELYYAGAWEFTRTLKESPRLVVHVGASVAASRHLPLAGFAELAADLMVRTHIEPATHARVEAVMSRLAVACEVVAHPRDPVAWHGESSCWAPFGMPMISFAGDFPAFHTPEDTPGNVTTPALLEQVDRVFLEAVTTALEP